MSYHAQCPSSVRSFMFLRPILAMSTQLAPIEAAKRIRRAPQSLHDIPLKLVATCWSSARGHAFWLWHCLRDITSLGAARTFCMTGAGPGGRFVQMPTTLRAGRLMDIKPRILKGGDTLVAPGSGGALAIPPIDALLAFQRATNYLSTAQIYLQKNVLLARPLEKSDVKPCLLGHFGTCPGLNLVYAHANLLKRHTNLNAIYVTDPGHGAPAVLASLYIEGTLSHFYPDYPVRADGFEKLTKAFSWPGGFPSHVNAETPGAIHEGGERPNLITVGVVGDGEAETGPTATAWHGHKYVDPAESGTILPVRHVNGFKISERTIFGTMDDFELAALFTGYGYQPRIVDYGAIARFITTAGTLARGIAGKTRIAGTARRKQCPCQEDAACLPLRIAQSCAGGRIKLAASLDSPAR
ncbi:Thiamin diphosphate-binding protein [Auricularia subglabra TFB-10046 SS5]|uniref:Thiamin diphosphate-binding protein n=1 Tax=Auricularia subglabra (strain TFB-10046 / SS5) TaxID=717982 RepID=J0D2L9_AURST|nr:Thiamin diphosphate-binding protein [Auricularia subglabra TFB-10046 SS5]